MFTDSLTQPALCLVYQVRMVKVSTIMGRYFVVQSNSECISDREQLLTLQHEG